MTISPSKIEVAVVRPDENGKPETFNGTLSWTHRSDAAAGELEEVFGYAKKHVSLSDISESCEEALRQYGKDPTDFDVSDPTKSRQAISAMSPGIYKVMWSYRGRDCSYDEYVIDHDRMLDVDACKYHVHIRLVNRVR